MVPSLRRSRKSIQTQVRHLYGTRQRDSTDALYRGVWVAKWPRVKSRKKKRRGRLTSLKEQAEEDERMAVIPGIQRQKKVIDEKVDDLTRVV